MCENRRTLWSDLEDMERAFKMGNYNIPKQEMLDNIKKERDSCYSIYAKRVKESNKAFKHIGSFTLLFVVIAIAAICIKAYFN